MEFPRLCSLLTPELLLDVAALGLAWFPQLHGHAAWDRWELWHPLHKRDLGRWTTTQGLEVVRASPCVWTQVQGHGEWILKQNIQTHQHQPGADVIGHLRAGGLLPWCRNLGVLLPSDNPRTDTSAASATGPKWPWLWEENNPGYGAPMTGEGDTLLCYWSHCENFKTMVMIVLVLMKLMSWCRFEKTK